MRRGDVGRAYQFTHTAASHQALGMPRHALVRGDLSSGIQVDRSPRDRLAPLLRSTRVASVGLTETGGGRCSSERVGRSPAFFAQPNSMGHQLNGGTAGSASAAL